MLDFFKRGWVELVISALPMKIGVQQLGKGFRFLLLGGFTRGLARCAGFDFFGDVLDAVVFAAAKLKVEHHQVDEFIEFCCVVGKLNLWGDGLLMLLREAYGEDVFEYTKVLLGLQDGFESLDDR